MKHARLVHHNLPKIIAQTYCQESLLHKVSIHHTTRGDYIRSSITDFVFRLLDYH